MSSKNEENKSKESKNEETLNQTDIQNNFYLTEKKIRDEVAIEYKSYFGVMVFFTILIIGALAFFIYDYINHNKNHVPVENCNKPAGEFATEPETDYSQNCTLISCVDSSGRPNQPCIFNGVNNINQAIKICNQNIDKCHRFSYFSSTNSMSLVTLNCPNPVSSPNVISFVRQVGITYTDPQDNKKETTTGLENPTTVTTVNSFNPSSSTFSSGSQIVGSNVASY